MKITAILAATALLATAISANATALVDGSFEIKGAANPVLKYCYDGFSTIGGPGCAASVWGGHGNGVIASGDASWGGTFTEHGAYYGFVQGSSKIVQSFLADGNGVASLSWFDTNRTNLGDAQTYNVSIFDGVSTFDLGTFTSATGGFVERTSASFTLVTGTEYRLTFAGRSPDDRAVFIDNIALVVTQDPQIVPGVPEPATWAMLLIGFGMIGATARRRKIGSVAA